MRIYVIGPVSGFDDLNVPAFEAARLKLSVAGYIPLIPHDFISADADWQKAMRISLETIAKADGVAYLDGWQRSNGARLEQEIARALGIDVAAVDSWCAVGGSIQEIEGRQQRRRLCPHCGRILPVELFDRSTENASGLQGYCRNCMTDYKQNREGEGNDR